MQPQIVWVTGNVITKGKRAVAWSWQIIYVFASSTPPCIMHRKKFWSCWAHLPITVAARSKAWTVFSRSNTGIMGSNPTRGMDVCVLLFCVCVVLRVGSGLVTADPPPKESYQLCIRLKNWKSAQGPTKDCRAIDRYIDRRMDGWMDGWMDG
jgi:hypothetical protein